MKIVLSLIILISFNSYSGYKFQGDMHLKKLTEDTTAMLRDSSFKCIGYIDAIVQLKGKVKGIKEYDKSIDNWKKTKAEDLKNLKSKTIRQRNETYIKIEHDLFELTCSYADSLRKKYRKVSL